MRHAHDTGLDIVLEPEDRGGGLADNEARPKRDRRQQSFEAFACLGQFCRDDGRGGVCFEPHMRCDKPDDPLGLMRRQRDAGVGAPGAVAVEPKLSVRIDDDLDDIGLIKRLGDRRPHRRAQHALTAGTGFGGEKLTHHLPRGHANCRTRIQPIQLHCSCPLNESRCRRTVSSAAFGIRRCQSRTGPGFRAAPSQAPR